MSKSWCFDDEPYVMDDERRYLTFQDLARLNVIAFTYHSAFGYNFGDHYGDDFDELVSIVPGLITLGEVDATDENELDIVPSRPAIFDLKVARNRGETAMIPHSKVVIRLWSGWYTKPPKVTHTRFSNQKILNKPVYWYEFPFEQNRVNKGDVFVPPLSSRSYIIVKSPFVEIEIDSIAKKSPITYDDIYFATRGLCSDDTRSSPQYHVGADDGHTLTLIVDIDNYST